ncbi:hypothetical protein RDWZM_003012 [Blomia tropicalis]|uniref:RNA helicase n=1 Tax=Blomia tropicalis TaxID=40697 RepID=A0A9Q0MF14_BLOTA|nr:hypothetical protein RDWZM_003012 [Blomia tropicalis]
MTEKKFFGSRNQDYRQSGHGYGSDRGGYGRSRNDSRGGYGNVPNGRPFYRKAIPPPPPASLPVYKAFYKEHSKTSSRSRYEIDEWLNKNSITFRGSNILNPILEFDELVGLPNFVMESMTKQGFTSPTVIQAQGWPFALSGRDMVGIAQTGSGKTFGYTLPALMHVEGNIHRRSHGPSVLVLAPTRELAQQIKEVVNIFKSARSVCIFGGASKVGQRREIERVQPSIIIACPGRLIDFVEEGSITLQNISYLVLDEADRMLDMGFEPQIRKIVEKVPKDRQTLMWSATWPKEVRKLAEDFLTNYVQVNIGSVTLSANHNITQIIDVCEEGEKYTKLYKLLTDINANSRENKTIIFAETKRKVDELSNQMRAVGWLVNSIHGDKPQSERDWVLNDFRTGRNTILIATDVAARGLDVDDIKYVVNFDYPNCSEDYVHRIGRTGRRDRKGTSYTFFTSNNAKQANELIDVLKEANQEIGSKLYELASQSYRYGKNPRKRYGGYGGNSYGGNRFGGSSNGFSRRPYNGNGNSNGYTNGVKRKSDDTSGDSKRFKPSGGFGRQNGSSTTNGYSQDRFSSYS